jgi:DedD protein
MSLFSFLGRKKKQESATGAPSFTSRSEEESQAYRNRSKKKTDNASQKPSEAALPEKKRARRRLVGAIALVLAAIIGLPMLLDSEQKAVPDDIAIQIPSMDTPPASDAATASVPPAPPAGASSSGTVSAAAGLGQQEEIIDPAATPDTGSAIAEVAPEPPVQPKHEPKPAPKAEAQPKPEPRTESKPEPKPESKPEPKPEPKHIAKVDETARARAILEGRAETVAPQKTSSKVTLQIAALATQEKVAELQGKLNDAGIKSYTQKVTTQSGTRIRVRVGPFASKEEAEKMRAKLVQLGYGGTLVPVN